MLQKLVRLVKEWMGLTDFSPSPTLLPPPPCQYPHVHKSINNKTKIYLVINKPNCWEWSVNLDYYHRDGDHPARLVDGFYWYYDKGKVVRSHGSKSR